MSADRIVRNFTILTKRADLTTEQFREHWTHVHGPIAARLPGLRSYVQHHVTDTAARADFPAPAPTVDGIVELVFDSREQMEAALTGPVGEELIADAANFMSQMRKYVVEDVVIVSDGGIE